MKTKTFKKSERLHKKKHIQELFSKGSSFYSYPLKIRFLTSPDQESEAHQVLISVSKRNFKKAVDRNLIKRRIRESYRLNKSLIHSPPYLLIAYIYTAKEILSYTTIQDGLILASERLNKME